MGLLELLDRLRKLRKPSQTRVYVRNPTVEELRSNPMNPYFVVAWVNFTSEAGNRYTAEHVFIDPSDSKIALTSPDKDEDDFRYVGEILAIHAEGKAKNNIRYRSTDILDFIDLPTRTTQPSVVDLVEKYQRHFSDVRISRVYFYNEGDIPYKDSGLPLEKLTVQHT